MRININSRINNRCRRLSDSSLLLRSQLRPVEWPRPFCTCPSPYLRTLRLTDTSDMDGEGEPLRHALPNKKRLRVTEKRRKIIAHSFIKLLFYERKHSIWSRAAFNFRYQNMALRCDIRPRSHVRHRRYIATIDSSFQCLKTHEYSRQKSKRACSPCVTARWGRFYLDYGTWSVPSSTCGSQDGAKCRAGFGGRRSVGGKSGSSGQLMSLPDCFVIAVTDSWLQWTLEAFEFKTDSKKKKKY